MLSPVSLPSFNNPKNWSKAMDTLVDKSYLRVLVAGLLKRNSSTYFKPKQLISVHRDFYHLNDNKRSRGGCQGVNWKIRVVLLSSWS